MKRVLGLLMVLLVFGVVGCAQIDLAQTKEAVFQPVTKLTVKIKADAPTSTPVPADPYIWAVGELGTALGGTVDFWGAKAKLVGPYGQAYTLKASDFSGSSQWGNSDKLDFKFVVTSGDGAPADGCKIDNGGGNFSLSLQVLNVEVGKEKSTANPGVTYIAE